MKFQQISWRAHFAGSVPRRILYLLLGSALVLLGMTAGGTPANADTGGNHHLHLATSPAGPGKTNVEITITPPFDAWYHVQLWSGGWMMNDDDVYLLGGGAREATIRIPVPAGRTLCAHLWRHTGNGFHDRGSYVGEGLPCVSTS
jgi:hypothetical protein